MYIIPLKQGIQLITIGFSSEGLYTVSRKFPKSTGNISWKRTRLSDKENADPNDAISLGTGTGPQTVRNGPRK